MILHRHFTPWEEIEGAENLVNIKPRFEVYEDCASEVYLCLFNGDICEHIFENWECRDRGDLAKALAELAENENAFVNWYGEINERPVVLSVDPPDTPYQTLYEEGIGMLIANNGGIYGVPEYAGRYALGIDLQPEEHETLDDLGSILRHS